MFPKKEHLISSMSAWSKVCTEKNQEKAYQQHEGAQ